MFPKPFTLSLLRVRVLRNSQNYVKVLAKPQSYRFLEFYLVSVSKDKNNKNKEVKKRVSYLLQEDHDEAVEFDGRHPGQSGQGEVGDNTDEREVGDAEEDGEDSSEQSARGRRIVPVHQLFTRLLQQS